MNRKTTPLLVALAAWLWLIANPLHAQVYTQRMPVGSSLNGIGVLGGSDPAPVIDLPLVDTASLLREDEQRGQKGLPMRIGVGLPVSIDVMQPAGQVERNGFRLSMYRINVPGALATSIVFDRLQLAEGARLFMYDANRTILVGPITARQNGPDFWTDFLPGSSVVIEVQEPVKAVGQSAVHVAGVVHSLPRRDQFAKVVRDGGRLGSV